MKWMASIAKTLRFCIVGAGPAGLYAAERLLKRLPDIQIDILDRLPFPFGLVETGVAPDHASTKNVRNGWTQFLHSSQCRFFGNVRLDKDVFFRDLKRRYHGVVLSCGAESDRKLGLDGEDADRVLTAREFVWWFNGHPDSCNLPIDLKNVKNVAIVGAGNVAIDCARILIKPWTDFEKTDMALHAIESLKTSSVENVYLIARRGISDAKFTPKELREIVHLPNVRYFLQSSDFELTKKEALEIEKVRRKRRVFEILKTASEKTSFPESHSFHRSLHFLFGKRIQTIHLSKAASIESIILTSDSTEFERQRLDVDLLITSIGTKAHPISDVPFDDRLGIVPNIDGRVIDPDTQQAIEGLYVSGWLKRGASGIIGTNLIDAEEVSEAIFEDIERLKMRSLSEGSIESVLKERNVRFVSFQNWLKLQKIEKQRGKDKNKEREKIVTIDEMLRVCFDD